MSTLTRNVFITYTNPNFYQEGKGYNNCNNNKTFTELQKDYDQRFVGTVIKSIDFKLNSIGAAKQVKVLNSEIKRAPHYVVPLLLCRLNENELFTTVIKGGLLCFFKLNNDYEIKGKGFITNTRDNMKDDGILLLLNNKKYVKNLYEFAPHINNFTFVNNNIRLFKRGNFLYEENMSNKTLNFYDRSIVIKFDTYANTFNIFYGELSEDYKSSNRNLNAYNKSNEKEFGNVYITLNSNTIKDKKTNEVTIQFRMFGEMIGEVNVTKETFKVDPLFGDFSKQFLQEIMKVYDQLFNFKITDKVEIPIAIAKRFGLIGFSGESDKYVFV